MVKILISGCLLGQKVRYDGRDCLQNHTRLQEWIRAGNVISVCPEVAGGLLTPRPWAEIQLKKTGIEVLKGEAQIITNSGQNVSAAFIEGAKQALALAQKYDIQVAILKANSPSCGSDKIYDGSFTGSLIPGSGVTAVLLRQNGIMIFDENHIDEALDAAEQGTAPL